MAVALAVAVIATACGGGGDKADVSAGSLANTGSAAGNGAVTTMDVPPLTMVTTPDGQPATPEGQPETAQPGGDPARGGRTEETAPPRQPRRIAYPAGGVKGTVYPPNVDAYELLTSQTQTGCSTLLAETEGWPTDDFPPSAQVTFLYSAAANACLSNWDAAVADFDRLAPLAEKFDDDSCPPDKVEQAQCPRCEQAVLAWLTEVMNAYKSDPGLPPVLTGTGEAPC